MSKLKFWWGQATLHILLASTHIILLSYNGIKAVLLWTIVADIPLTKWWKRKTSVIEQIESLCYQIDSNENTALFL